MLSATFATVSTISPSPNRRRARPRSASESSPRWTTMLRASLRIASVLASAALFRRGLRGRAPRSDPGVLQAPPAHSQERETVSAPARISLVSPRRVARSRRLHDRDQLARCDSGPGIRPSIPPVDCARYKDSFRAKPRLAEKRVRAGSFWGLAKSAGPRRIVKLRFLAKGLPRRG